MADVQTEPSTVIYVTKKIKILQAFLQDQINALIPATSKSGLIATGTNQSTALVLTKTRNRIDTAASGTGVKPNVTATEGFTQIIQNKGANDITYYPFLGNNFLGAAANAGVVIVAGNELAVYCYDDGELTII